MLVVKAAKAAVPEAQVVLVVVPAVKGAKAAVPEAQVVLVVKVAKAEVLAEQVVLAVGLAVKVAKAAVRVVQVALPVSQVSLAVGAMVEPVVLEEPQVSQVSREGVVMAEPVVVLEALAAVRGNQDVPAAVVVVAAEELVVPGVELVAEEVHRASLDNQELAGRVAPAEVLVVKVAKPFSSTTVEARAKLALEELGMNLGAGNPSLPSTVKKSSLPLR